MKYITNSIAEQETTINVDYDNQIISIYSSRKEVIMSLTKYIGRPTERHCKNKSYWTGAVWNIPFYEKELISKIFEYAAFIDNNLKIKEPKKIVKKVVKKEEPKKVAKKVAKKEEPKKVAKKVAKKEEPKKVVKKVAKKEEPKKVVKKVAKKEKPKNKVIKENKLVQMSLFDM